MNLKGYDATYLDCRDLRHPWRVLGYYRTPEGEIARDLICPRCGSEATDRRTKEGQRVGRSYRYAEGYLLTADDRPDTRALGREVIRRARVFASAEAMLTALTEGGRRNGR